MICELDDMGERVETVRDELAYGSRTGFERTPEEGVGKRASFDQMQERLGCCRETCEEMMRREICGARGPCRGQSTMNSARA